MLALLSPAKDMKVLPLEVKATEKYTLPDFLNKSAGLITDLKRLQAHELASLMKISDKLAVLNYDRYRNWKKEHTVENSSQAVLSFTGEAYRGLNAGDFDAEQLDYLQNSLRILSGLYGVLRPLDLIQEHRLEMGTKHSFRDMKNLYSYWKTLNTRAISHAITQSPGEKVLVNLASTEYFFSIDTKKIKQRIVTPSFYEEKNGKRKMIMVFAKKARGMMTRFMVENKLEKAEDLKAFTSEGYYFDSKQSTDDKLIFVR